MTPEERSLILDAVSTADGGCRGCVDGVITALEALLPDEPWRADYGAVDYDAIRVRERRATQAVWRKQYPDDPDPSGSDDK